MTGERHAEWEREFLKGAERLAGLDIGWAQDVTDRLTNNERSKGKDSYRELTMDRMLREIHEEALDVGGWPVLAALLSYASTLPDDEQHHLRLLLQNMAAYGVRIAGLVNEARELLEA